MRFRPEIQGLRGIAILAVVFYHARVEWLMGGFVGVDVFFVISGFLIYGIIDRDIRDGSFSIVTFFAKRIKRLYPAFLAFMLLTLVAVNLFFLPEDILPFNSSYIAALKQTANIYFYERTGYFDLHADLSPLLHLWSISVEWQFYLVFPFVAAFLCRLGPRALPRLLPLLTLAGFAASLYVFRDQSAAFYLFPFRAWEMLFGAMLVGINPAGRSATQYNAGYIAGCLLIAIPVVLYGYAPIPFPGPSALLPCAGTGLLILCHEGATIRLKNLFSSGALVYVGEISYSLYLVHWPFLSLGRYYDFATMRHHTVASSLLCLIPAAGVTLLLYYLVERPARRARMSRLVVFASAACLTFCLLGLRRYTGSRARSAILSAAESTEIGEFLSGGDFRIEQPFTVPIAGKDGKPEEVIFQRLGDFDETADTIDFLLMGDSQALMWSRSLDKFCRERNIRGLMSYSESVMFDLYRHAAARENAAAMQKGIREAIRRFEIKRVFIAYLWNAYTEEVDEKILRVWDPQYGTINPMTNELGGLGRNELLDAGLTRGLRELRELGVEESFIVLPLPILPFSMGTTLSYIRHFGGRPDFSQVEMTGVEYDAQARQTRELIANHVPPAKLVNLPEAYLRLGDGESFPLFLNGRAVYSDYCHLSFAGTEAMKDIFTDILAIPPGNGGETTADAVPHP